MESDRQSERPPSKSTASGESNVPLKMINVLYDELRQLAAAKMAKEYGPQTLQSTALVHEAWIRLGGDKQPEWKNKAQFFASAAEAMRRILVDRARRRRALRHGGDQKRAYLDTVQWEGIDKGSEEHCDDRIIGLHEAIERFSLEDPQAAELVKLRYFTGMGIAESAKVLDISERTARRWLAYARAWLGRAMDTTA